jgi:cation diffusion facilitator family transporter
MMPHQPELEKTRAARIALIGGLLVFALKLLGAWFTQSVGVLSDALESMVNVVAAGVTAWAVAVASRPPDEEHPYGHEKAEYLSSILEALLIGIAGALIVSEAWQRLNNPRALEWSWPGLIIMSIASALNWLLGHYLVRSGKNLRSQALESDGRHVLSDVVTSIGVLFGTGLAIYTRVPWLDPLLAFLVATFLIALAVRLLRENIQGLMDTALEPADLQRLNDVLEQHRDLYLEFHDLRTRNSGSKQFVDFHLILPSSLSVQEAHARCDTIEEAMLRVLPSASITIHVEPEDRLHGAVDVQL